MTPGEKIFWSGLAMVAFAFLFVPIVPKPDPTDCNNYPDGTGGYYSECKDKYINLYTKWTKY
jgi:hypothetical protein